MTQVEGSDETATRPGRGVVAAIAVGALLVVGYFATGMPGMDHGSATSDDGSMASTEHNSMPFMRLGPDDFAARVAEPSVFVANVHTPYAGEIDGTDAFIPFDEITGDRGLPTDKDTEIVLYCQSGRMSQIAADTLVDAGYTNVVDLDGGMNAWKAAGMPVRNEPPAGT